MPITDPPFTPTHPINTDEYNGKLYIPTDLMTNTAVASYGSGGIVTASSTYASDVKEIERLKKALEEEHEKRILAESREAVLKVRIQNSEDNKQDDEDEIQRLESQLSHHKKIHRDIMFIMADALTGSSASGYSNVNHQNVLRQVVQALKQEPKKM